jgi:hypothetical protein
MTLTDGSIVHHGKVYPSIQKLLQEHVMNSANIVFEDKCEWMAQHLDPS